MTMTLDWVEELPTVYSILQHNPEAIVDDTAIERLLGWLEATCRQPAGYPELLTDKVKTFQFLQSDLVLKHPLSLAFVVRYAGYLGAYAHHIPKVREVITNLIHATKQCDLFTNPSVRYAWFLALTSVADELSWLSFVHEFVPDVIVVFCQGTLFVQKAAMKFMSRVLYSSWANDVNFPGLLAFAKLEDKTDLVASSIISLILDTAATLCAASSAASKSYLCSEQLIPVAMNKIEHLASSVGCSILDSLIHVLQSIMPSIVSGLEIRKVLLSELTLEKSYRYRIFEFLTFVGDCRPFAALFPRLCASLLCRPDVSSYEKDVSWNKEILLLLLRDMLPPCEAGDGTGVSSGCDTPAEDKLEFKTRLVAVTGVLSEHIEKIAADGECHGLLRRSAFFSLRVLKVALSVVTDDGGLNHAIPSIVNDKKLARVCFSFMREFLRLGKVSVEDGKLFLDDVVLLMSIRSDDTQVTCSSLELLTSFVSVAPRESLVPLLAPCESLVDSSVRDCPPVSEAQPVHVSPSGARSVAAILNRRMYDASWEVKDSLLSLLSVLLNKAKRENCPVCHYFLKNNTFWLKIVDLISDEESYVRAAAVTLVGIIPTVSSLWSWFCQETSLSCQLLLKSFHAMFMDEQQQDDMFVRRSILELVDTWVEELRVCLLFLADDHSAECRELSPVLSGLCDADLADMRTKLLELLARAVLDFDWEVRTRTLNVWTSVFRTISRLGKPELSDALLSVFVSSGSARYALSSVCDSEFNVSMCAVTCLRECSSVSTVQRACLESPLVDDDVIGLPVKRRKTLHVSTPVIDTVSELEQALTSHGALSRDEFFTILCRVDFEALMHSLEPLDVQVKSDPASFLQDIIASARQSEENLLDCY